MALSQVAQDDFAVGILRGVAPDVQPGVGLTNAVNGLLDDDGDIYRRGGDTYYSAFPAGANPLTFIWTGYLNNQPKMLLGDKTGLFTLDAAKRLAPIAGGAPVLAPVLPAVIANTVYLPNLSKWNGTLAAAWTRPAALPAAGTLHVASVAQRLVVASGNRIAFSVAEQPDNFVADDFHELPSGVVVIGLASARDTLLIFSNYGMWTVSNMSFNLTDALGNIQQVLGLLAPEISLWHESGLAEWSGRWIAPCIDRVYMVDAVSQPVAISDSITPIYMGHVRGGYRPGGAKVFRNTLFLPILTQDVATPHALLTCRLNRPIRGRQVYYPWTTFEGHAARVVMGDVSLIDATPKFLAAHQDGRVTSLTDVFNPSDSVAADADGTVHAFDVETRDYATGTGQPNHVRKLRLRYTLENAPGTLARVTAGVSYGAVGQTYEAVREHSGDYAQVDASYASYEELFRGGAGLVGDLPRSPDDPLRYWVTVSDQTLPEPGADPVSWRFSRAARVRYVRVRFRITDPVAKFTIHHLDLAVRPATHDR
jgi:hypothetical protein